MSLDIYFHDDKGEEIYWKNITHNLNSMAAEAYIYKCLWRPEENGYEVASDLVTPLKDAIKDMEKQPGRYKRYSASNGWGTYEQFLPWLKELLDACKLHPNAKIRTSR